ncbi:MAG TPA: crossover junction endodeoxyribonuclease RuvC [Candidatus Dormibacteraeota bacterium]|nr:crossover junction endodeoxyribonuclease RuvC [Candidatus Dormibacteraeota bacterium]
MGDRVGRLRSGAEPARGGPLYLGVDPGLAATGWGLIDDDTRVVACGTVRTSPGPAAPRLLRIVDELRSVVAAYPVGEAALEELFVGRNATSVIGVAQARGAILAALASAGVDVHEYKPAQVKAVLTGYGMATKAQMARMLSLQAPVPRRLDDHAADAVAIAICHARSRRLHRLVAT